MLRRWHGPAVLLALEGGNTPTAGYVAFRGNITKVAMEHMRHASALERLASEEWEEILTDVINAVDGNSARPRLGGDGAEQESIEQEEATLPGQVVEEDVATLPGDAGASRRTSAAPSHNTVVFPYPFPAEFMRPTPAASSVGQSLAGSSMPSRQVSTQARPGGVDGALVPVPDDEAM